MILLALLLGLVGCQRHQPPVPLVDEHSVDMEPIALKDMQYEIVCEQGRLLFMNNTLGVAMETLEAYKMPAEAEWRICQE